MIATNAVFVSNTNSEEMFFLSDINGRTFSIRQQFDTMLQRTKLKFQSLASGVYILMNNKGSKWKLIVQ